MYPDTFEFLYVCLLNEICHTIKCRNKFLVDSAIEEKNYTIFSKLHTKKHSSVNLVQKEILYMVDQGHTFSLCLLSLSQKLKAPSDPAVANVWCT